jgi:hypothetical protein
MFCNVLQEMVGVPGLDFSGSGYGQVVGSFEHGIPLNADNFLIC